MDPGDSRVPDRPRTKLSVELPFSGSDWRPRRLRAVSGRLCQTADLVILSGAFLGIVVLPVFAHEGSSLAGLLQLRVSLRNVLVAALCISTWRMILMSVGVYTPTRTRSLTDYLLRCIIAARRRHDKGKDFAGR